jgi:hypothetical protein
MPLSYQVRLSASRRAGSRDGPQRRGAADQLPADPAVLGGTEPVQALDACRGGPYTTAESRQISLKLGSLTARDRLEGSHEVGLRPPDPA